MSLLQALVSNNNQAGGEGGSSKGGSGSRQEAKRNLMSQEELRELFSLQADALSHTYEVLLREAKARQMQEQQDQIQALLQELQEQERSGGLGAECSMGGDADVVAQGGAGGVERTTTGTAGMEDAGVCGNPLGQIEGPVVHKPQEGLPTTEEELAAWGWHSDPATVTCDPVMQVGGCLSAGDGEQQQLSITLSHTGGGCQCRPACRAGWHQAPGFLIVMSCCVCAAAGGGR
jgi:hypothetical protein